ncbi:T6SS effector amidase Tae4 family protein [uncultured Capnocytophaga sp.]|uniref:T6SS effector amidase Tae4 family protein n=1 Tax=uncultured Capnocytophaga sp. TaxID=159273 RepID=UPI00262A182C|nr:T6SS effector amidase Tae4 family protein [uncultured Capnocytophaga sp.]
MKDKIIEKVNFTLRVPSIGYEKTITLTVKEKKRPKWIDVYRGYPKIEDGTDDLPGDEVFSKVFGDLYHKDDSSLHTKKGSIIFMENACATRVSLGLLEGGVNIKNPDFYVQNEKEKSIYGKPIIVKASKLESFLTKEWGEADKIITSFSKVEEVVDEINSEGEKNGIYIILGGNFSPEVTGHASLWVGAEKNVIGGNDYAEVGETIYFWELE